jgi:hypothetical protein
VNVTAAQVDFIEAQARLTIASSERDTAQARYHNAEREFRAAWCRMSADEQEAVNHACVLLNEPETAT